MFTSRRFSAFSTLGVSAVIAMCAITTPGAAQARKGASTSTTRPPISGIWIGTATVQLGDSTIIVPVTYTFAQGTTGVAGTAMVPGQGTGPISNVVRTGSRIQFRVTAPENRLLEHDGKFAADSTVEGIVNLNNQPVAKFRIAAKVAPKK